jgi:hypothetical protein
MIQKFASLSRPSKANGAQLGLLDAISVGQTAKLPKAEKAADSHREPSLDQTIATLMVGVSRNIHPCLPARGIVDCLN